MKRNVRPIGGGHGMRQWQEWPQYHKNQADFIAGLEKRLDDQALLIERLYEEIRGLRSNGGDK